MTDVKEKVFGIINLQITEQTVEDMLFTAFDSKYGGCKYFLGSYPTTVGKRKGKDIFESFAKYAQDLEIILDEEAGGETHILTRTKLLNGLQLAVQNGINISVVSNEDRADSVEADCIIQYALFGEIIYG